MKTRRKLLIAGLLPAVLGATAEGATSATLAPAKPSQIVTLKSSSNNCPALGQAVDQQILLRQRRLLLERDVRAEEGAEAAARRPRRRAGGSGRW